MILARVWQAAWVGTVRAEVDGAVGRLAVAAPGVAVLAGDEIAAVVPQGDSAVAV